MSLPARVLRRVALLLVLAGLAALPPLASSTPPDPSWIPGLYDDADYDDVVVLISSGPGGVGIAVTPDLRPVALLVERLGEPADRLAPTPSALPLHSRAPPAP